MPRVPSSLRVILPVCSLPLALTAATAHASTYSGPVAKSEWTTSDVPSYIDMYIAVPDTMPEKPPILVNIHSCGNNAGGQWSYDGFAPLREALDSVGFIMILPQQSRNCWNVGAPESLEHGGGGDTGAIVQMVEYALQKYNGDPTRVYVMGGSGGGMCTQALLAVYPELFKAGHSRAGVPAGCWAQNYDDGMQWSTPCANGMVDKTPEEWGNYVRGINPDFTGPRPRIQLNHGDADGTINFKNFGESIDEWTNVLGLDAMPTSTDTGFKGAAKVSSTGAAMVYDRSFWKDECGYTVLEAWEAINQDHNMGYEAASILEWFGLDQKRDKDPWDEQCAGMSTAPSDTGSAGGAGSVPEPTSSGGAGGAGPTAEPAGDAGGGTMVPAPAPSSVGTVAPPSMSMNPPPAGSTTGAPAMTVGVPGPTPPSMPMPVQNLPAPGANPAPTPTVASMDTATSGTPAASTTAPTPSSSAPAGVASDTSDSSDGGCSTTGRATVFGFPMVLAALGLLVGRRRRSLV